MPIGCVISNPIGCYYKIKDEQLCPMSACASMYNNFQKTSWNIFKLRIHFDDIFFKTAYLRLFA